MKRTKFLITLLLLVLSLGISPSVNTTAQNFPEFGDIVTGIQDAKIDGYIDEFQPTNKKFISEWQDASKTEASLISQSGNEVGLILFNKINPMTSSNYLAGEFTQSAIPENSIRAISVQLDTDSNGKLTEGDVRARTVYQSLNGEFQTGNPLLDQTTPLLDVYTGQEWLPAVQMLNNYDKQSSIQSDSSWFGSIGGILNPIVHETAIGTNYETGNTQFEMKVNLKGVQSVLNELSIDHNFQSTVKQLKTANYAIQVETNEGQVYSYPETTKDLSEADYQYASDGYNIRYWEYQPKLDINFVDVGVDKLEVTQTIQNASDDLRLAQDQPTLARVFVDNPTGQQQSVKVMLTGWQVEPGNIQKLSTLSKNYNAPQNVDVDRTDIDDTANFELPDHWVDDPGIVLKAEVQGLNGYDANSNNNDEWKYYQLVDTRDLNIFRMNVNTGSEDFPTLPIDSNVDMIDEYYDLAVPTDPNYVELGWETLGEFDGDADDLITKMNIIILGIALSGGSYPTLDQFHATVPQSFTNRANGGGLSDPDWPNYNGAGYSSWGGFDATSGELVSAHEMNHNYMPEPKAYHIGGCGADHSDGDWNSTYSGGYYQIHDLGWNPNDGLIDNSYNDYMSYCNDFGTPSKWTSGYRWEHLLDRLASFSAGSPNPMLSMDQEEVVSGNYQLVTGHFFNPETTSSDYPAVLDQSFNKTANDVPKEFLDDFMLPEYNPDIPYRVEVKYNDGQILYGSHLPDFETTEGGILDNDSFTYLLPNAQNIMSISLNNTKGSPISQPLVRTGQFAGEPSFGNFPFGEQVSRQESYSLSWKQAVESPYPIESRLEYTPDDGKTWIPIGQGEEGITAKQIVFSKLPGSVYKSSSSFRLIQSNGIKTHTFRTPNFHLSPLNPNVEIKKSQTFEKGETNDGILTKSSDNVIQVTKGDTVSLEAKASDSFGNSYSRGSYSWYIEDTTNLVLDQQSSVSDLSKMAKQFYKPGLYQVTVQVTDPNTGLSSQDSVMVNVSQTEGYMNAELYSSFKSQLDTLRENYDEADSGQQTVTKSTTETITEFNQSSEVNGSAQTTLPFTSVSVVAIAIINVAIIARRRTKPE